MAAAFFSIAGDYAKKTVISFIASRTKQMDYCDIVLLENFCDKTCKVIELLRREY